MSNFYNASKDPTAIELAKQLPTPADPRAEIIRILDAFDEAEPERQLCIICLLEVATNDYTGLSGMKKAAINRMLANMGESNRF